MATARSMSNARHRARPIPGGRASGRGRPRRGSRWDVPVAHRRDDVHSDERQAEQGQVAVHGLRQEAGPPLARPPHRRHGAEDDGGGEEDERHQPGGAGEVPEGGGAVPHRRHDRVVIGRVIRRDDRSSGTGHPEVRTTVPSVRTSRAGRTSSSSQATARSPSTIAAVEAAFAWTQLAAVVETVRQHGRADSPVAGSTMWWTSCAPSRH